MKDHPQIELLAPGGDLDSIKAAIAAGADAIYCGLNDFNARSKAKNIDLDTLQGVIKVAHEYNCNVFLTLNIVILEKELRPITNLLNKLIHTKIDGLIVQDLGLLYLLNTYYKDLSIHASTQLTTHNRGQIDFLKKLGVERVNFCRELSLDEIAALNAYCQKKGVETEVFIHGAYCLSFSGLCYMSSVLTGKSGNRGRCSQPCRKRYATTRQGKDYPLNLKDNSALSEIKSLVDTGVSSLKIEGRMKGFDYVYTVVDTYRRQIDTSLGENHLPVQPDNLYTVFNRDFSDAHLTGNISKRQFIDNPKDFLLQRYKIKDNSIVDETLLAEKKQYTERKEQLSTTARKKMADIEIEKIAFQMPPARERQKLFSLPNLARPESNKDKPKLSVLIDSRSDLSLLEQEEVDLFFQLPNSFSKGAEEFIELFHDNERLIPCFPSLLIGEDYEIAVQILKNIQPQYIVSNNLGIGWEASKQRTGWIAGAELNITNSYSLLCLKEKQMCSGAFISSELNKKQIEAITAPSDFSLYFSIYHPLQLITCRHCLHQQVTGCKKERVDLDCLQYCKKSSNITDEDKKTFFVHKRRGNYTSLYNDRNYLNLEIIADLSHLFSHFQIDLRDIATQTKIETDKKEIISLFTVALSNDLPAHQTIEKKIRPTSYDQYQRGI